MAKPVQFERATPPLAPLQACARVGDLFRASLAEV